MLVVKRIFCSLSNRIRTASNISSAVINPCIAMYSVTSDKEDVNKSVPLAKAYKTVKNKISENPSLRHHKKCVTGSGAPAGTRGEACPGMVISMAGCATP